MKNVLIAPINREEKPLDRGGVVSSDFNEKRNASRYKNFGITCVVRSAHNDKINCMCNVINGAFLTGSSDKTIKCWIPFE